jgi:3-(methylsulfanyl)propanoyl-CoA dehydrogenase
MAYRAPVDEIAYTLRNIADLDAVLAARGSENQLAPELVDTILAGAGRFAESELDPINASGDRFGCVLTDGTVKTPPGWKEAYQRWTAGAWNGISVPAEWGGQDLPTMIGAAVAELWNAGSAAFALGPLLTTSAIEALQTHAAHDLKARYLPRLVSGDWMATMNLTEPQAGSDLGALATRAERCEDDTYRIFGHKVFISYGEHDLAENIVHLVLARLRDAPAGTAGISMFVVPKFLVNDNGALGERNNVRCVGIERKLGLHASPTCTMVFGDGDEGAIGWLVGEENRGLAAMFTMMNTARLSVGIQGVGVAARAYDRAVAFAHERRQGRAPGVMGEANSPIVEHPDVQRNLLTMKALTAAARAISYACAHALDMSRLSPAEEREQWADRTGLLTPIAKAFSTDVAITVASLGIQVHGGTGYIEETGAAQDLRDARIFGIYEGTNGIQAIDLVTRKLGLAAGAAVGRMIDDLGRTAGDAAAVNRDDFGQMGARLVAATERLSTATEYLTGAISEGRRAEALAGATPYLQLFGFTAGGVLLAKGALHAAAAGGGQQWISLARFFAENLVDETAGLLTRVVDGAPALGAAARTNLFDIAL